MQIAGEHLIPADREKVWQGLNDPETLRRSIPGCEYMERSGEHEFTATVVARVGPVEARFRGKVELDALDPPNGYVLRGRGQGGPAGFAKGEARVTLAAEDGGTRLHYRAEAEIGGRLASVGGRLVQSVARKTAEEFFDNFRAVVTGEADGDGVPGEGDGEATVGDVGAGVQRGATRQTDARHAARIPLIDRFAWLLLGVALGIGLSLLFG